MCEYKVDYTQYRLCTCIYNTIIIMIKYVICIQLDPHGFGRYRFLVLYKSIVCVCTVKVFKICVINICGFFFTFWRSRN